MTRVRLLTALCLCCVVAPRLVAQELPLRSWSVREGLIQSRVNAIRRDSNGYVWFATWDGASRFDGRRFVNYGSREGLPNPLVWCVAEGPDGEIWLGTHGGGLARVAHVGRLVLSDPSGPLNPAPRVFEIAFDSDARMWLVTSQGLYVSEPAPPGQLHFELKEELGPAWFGRSFRDEQGRLWFVAANEVVRCNGRELVRTALPNEDLGELRAIAPRRAGGCWVAHLRSLHVIEMPDAGGNPPTRRIQPIDFGSSTSLYDVCEEESGRLWVATSRGLLSIEGYEERWFASAQGLPDDWIHSLALDRDGGMWIGTHQGGAAFVPDSGVEQYTRRSGLGDGHVVKLVSLGEDHWIVASEVAGLFELTRGIVQGVPGSDRPPFDRIQHNLARDAQGEWWIGTAAGLFHVPGPQLDLSKAQRCHEVDGLAGSTVFVLGLDRSGQVLAATDDGRVFHGESAGARLRPLPFALAGAPVHSMAVESDGTLWLSDHSRLWRWRGERLESIEPWPEVDGSVQPRVLRVDSRGWLWMGTRFGGVAFTRDPAAQQPIFERLTTSQGLASDVIFALAEDREGTMIFGTGRGVQRYRPIEHSLESIGQDDGLAGEWITDLAFDARGDLWVASANGVSRMHMRTPHTPQMPQRVRFTRCVVAGADIALPAAGTFDVPSIEVDAKDSRLAFEYVAVDPVGGQRLRYQTRLEGLDDDWNEATAELSARYGQLAAGVYRFHVRCLDPRTGSTGEATSLRIEVVPPLWSRSWFIMLTVLAAACLGLAAHRLRLRRELALERVRTQIASDLHDDIGAALAQIAISSELARSTPPNEARHVMAEVAELARGLRSSMSDLVWAVDPRNDTLADVAGRMQHFANSVITGVAQSVAFNAPGEPDLARFLVAPDARRHLFLLFKESVTNIARHARASRVEIDLAVDGRRLRLSIRDDGCGFDPQAQYMGQGLRNLRRRARELTAEISIDSKPGLGTRILLDVSL